jgi:hypothetical protein
MKPADYIAELNSQLTYLFEFGRVINELDFAAALFNEFRGMQDAGWSTTITAHQVFSELQEVGNRESKLPLADYRQALCLYAQLSEAGGIYEGLLNLFGVVQLKPWNLWPFRDLVRVRSEPKRIIGPNANAMFRKLAQTAAAIGMPKLAELLAATFNDDVRNGMFHADYIIAHDGLRLRRRNGGQAYLISHAEVSDLITVGVAFFDLFGQMQRRAVESYRPAKRIIGRLSANPPMAWTIQFAEDGSFGISGNSPGAETDAAYERQQKINSFLDGRILASYASKETLLDEVQNGLAFYGFDPASVLLDEAKFSSLIERVEHENLWADCLQSDKTEFALLTTPFGFIRWSGVDAFRAILPHVEEVEFN